MSTYLAPREYLPHEPPMVLIDAVLSVAEEEAVTLVRVAPDGAVGPFLNAEGALPNLYALELMAQSIGIWAGFWDQARGRGRSSLGLILGSRGLNFNKPVFPAGAQLKTTVTLVFRDGNLGNFDARVCGEDGEVFAAGSLNTYDLRPEDLERFREQE